ncbi:hypothetical protein JOQ06_017477 [Pogonophryne albipinna]|uniref:HAT C-terminal dimerisation domain-containing protein n=1 Tax=Pogonophryne albipinna TaxID=1090488 RepID=A0AAD6B325_9TELE|nr:hypothetical protein JOQ06_017477 [Pogonophryne albipinna]
MISHYDPEIKRRLDDLPGNGKLTNPDIQNEILQIATSLLIRKMKMELHDETDTFYAILADECKDVSKRELVAVCIRYMHKAGITFPSLVEVLDSCPTDIFPQMNRLLRALVTLPITSCTLERVFSTVSRVKTGVRASMNTDRLNSLSLLSFERELTESLDYKDIISVFNTKPRRLLL